MKTKKTSGANVERKRFIFFEIGIIAALLLAISAFEWKSIVKEIKISGDDYDEFAEEMIINTYREKIKLPPPPKPNFEIEIVGNDRVDIEPVFIESSEIKQNDIIGVWVPDKPDEKPEEGAVTNAQIMPRFRNKEAKEYLNFVREHIVFPQLAKDVQLKGTVFVQFIIDEKGNLVNEEIVRGIDKALDEEVLRVVRLSKKERWTPGIQNMKPVKVAFTFPVKFDLKNF